MSIRSDIDLKGRISSRPELPARVVKSATRVLEVLEFFADIQREATVMEVANALNYPQSSASMLLRTMASMGYLDQGLRARTYITSSRVALLGSWVDRNFVQDGPLIQIMKELNQQTRDTIVLIGRIGIECQYIYVVQAISRARLHVTLGTTRPLARSGAGHAILSTLDDRKITALLHRINAESAPDKIVARAELLKKIAEVRRKGYAFNTDSITPGAGMLAAPLPPIAGQRPLAIGIGGISQVMRERERELAGYLKAAINRYAGAEARQGNGQAKASVRSGDTFNGGINNRPQGPALAMSAEYRRRAQ